MRTVWWFIGIVLAAAAILLLISLGRPPSVSEATADVCADLRSYGRSLLELRTIDESSTVADLQEANTAVQSNWEDLQNSVSTLREAQRAELEATHQALQENISSIPSDASLNQAQASLRLSVLDALASFVDIATTTCQFTRPEGATTLPQR
jgi:hypothetical protein